MAMPLIIRAIITGFGYKLGSELGRYVVDRVNARRRAKKETKADDDDLPDGLPKEPEGGAPTEPPVIVEPPSRPIVDE